MSSSNISCSKHQLIRKRKAEICLLAHGHAPEAVHLHTKAQPSSLKKSAKKRTSKMSHE